MEPKSTQRSIKRESIWKRIYKNKDTNKGIWKLLQVLPDTSGRAAIMAKKHQTVYDCTISYIGDLVKW
jgi:hypothetical protein